MLKFIFMKTLIVYPQTKAQLDALKAFMTALKIRFELIEDEYKPEFVSKIRIAGYRFKTMKHV